MEKPDSDLGVPYLLWRSLVRETLQPQPLEYGLLKQIGHASMAGLRRMKSIFIKGKIIRRRVVKQIHDGGTHIRRFHPYGAIKGLDTCLGHGRIGCSTKRSESCEVGKGGDHHSLR